jgi:hypothetical protein
MLEVLKNETEKAIRLADEADVNGLHDFLFAEPNKPMLFVGNGGMQGHYAGLLYEQNAGIARCITPFILRSMSDDTLRGCRCLLMSDGGKNMDIKDATTRMVKVNPEHTAAFTFWENEKNIFFKKMDKSRVFLFPHTELLTNGFISGSKKFYREALFYKAFTGNSAAKQMTFYFEPAHCYQYELNASDAPLTPLSAIKHFLVLHGGYGAPVAHELESMMTETGLASVQVCDYRNFCHGRFIFAGNHTRHTRRAHSLPESEVAVVLLVSPDEDKIATNIRKTTPNGDWQVLPNETPVITIKTDFDNPLASIDLSVKANVFFADLAENYHGFNPLNPPNYGGVRKEYPKGGLRW